MVEGSSEAPHTNIITHHTRAPDQGQGQPQGQVQRKSFRDSSSDSTTTTESRTSSSDDEIVSQVSLHMGFNPCKCCVCEDWDLRSHCMAIGIVEILFWLVFILVVVVYSLMSVGSEPVVTKGSQTAPPWYRRGVTETVGTTQAPGKEGEREEHGRINDPIFDVDPNGEGGGGMGILMDNLNETTTANYEIFLRSRMGEAAVLLRPNTRQGQLNWKENLQKYLVGITLTFTFTVILSIVAGVNIFLGAYGKKPFQLRCHSVVACVTGLVVLMLGVLLGLVGGYVQLLLSVLCAALYVYFAVCSVGLVTMIRAGFYDFAAAAAVGPAPAYSTILRANVKTEKGKDGHLNTLHPNEYR